MREIIKFKYYYSDGEKTFSRVFNMDEDIANGSHWDVISDSPFLKEYKIIGREQYTGLKDKNGVEIYEGDIIKHGKYSHINKIIYGDYEGDDSYYYCEGAFVTDDTLNNNIENDTTVVIGNIYENPELLDNDNKNKNDK